MDRSATKRATPRTVRPTSGDRRVLALLGLVLLISLSLRLAYLGEVRRAPDFARPQVDAEFHDYWARGLAFHDWTPPSGKTDPKIQASPFFRPPGYPYFLALVYAVAGPGYLGPRIAQILLGLAAALAAFFLGRRWLGSTAGLVASLLTGTYWILIYYEGEFLEPPLMVLFLLLLAHGLLRWRDAMRPRAAALAGLLLGLGALVRPNALVFLPVAIAWGLWIDRSRGSSGRRRASLAAFIAGAAIAILPATIRNLTVSGEPVLISSNAGVNLFLGNNPAADGRCPGSIEGLGKFKTCFDWPGIVRNLERRLGRPLNESQIDRHFAGEALRYAAAHPGRTLGLAARKTLLFWGPLEVSHNKVEEAERENSPLLRALPGGFTVAFALGALGFAWLWLDRRRARIAAARGPVQPPTSWEGAVLLAALAIAWFLSFVPFFVAARYRAPIVPLLLLLAVPAILRVAESARRKQWKPLAPMVAGAVLFFAIASVNWAGYKVDRARWHYARGMAYTADERHEPAISEYRRAVDLNPGYASAHNDLGLSLALRGRFEEALVHLEAAAKLEPEEKLFHLNLAAILEQQGRLEESLSHYEAAGRLDPAYRKAVEGALRVRALMDRRTAGGGEGR